MQKDSSLNDHATIKEKQPPGQINNNQLNNTIPKPTTFEISVRNPIINESQIKNKLSINKTGERKLLKLTVKYKNRWERIVKEFNGFGIRDLQGILAKTVKRVLNKCNRENDKLFHPSQINQLKTDFVIKIFNTMIRKRKQEYEEGYLDLVEKSMKASIKLREGIAKIEGIEAIYCGSKCRHSKHRQGIPWP